MTKNLELDRILPSKTNPRTDFDEAKLQELVNSIRRRVAKGLPGIHTALRVRPYTGGAAGIAPEDYGKFELIAGHRRLRAAEMAGLKSLPCTVESMPQKDVRLEQLLDNLHRDDLKAWEIGKVYRELIDAGTFTVETLCEEISKDRSHVFAMMQAANLEGPVRSAMEEGAVGVNAALKLAAGFKKHDVSPQEQGRVLQAVAGKSFREVAEVVKGLEPARPHGQELPGSCRPTKLTVWAVVTDEVIGPQKPNAHGVFSKPETHSIRVRGFDPKKYKLELHVACSELGRWFSSSSSQIGYSAHTALPSIGRGTIFQTKSEALAGAFAELLRYLFANGGSEREKKDSARISELLQEADLYRPAKTPAVLKPALPPAPVNGKHVDLKAEHQKAADEGCYFVVRRDGMETFVSPHGGWTNKIEKAKRYGTVEEARACAWMHAPGHSVIKAWPNGMFERVVDETNAATVVVRHAEVLLDDLKGAALNREALGILQKVAVAIADTLRKAEVSASRANHQSQPKAPLKAPKKKTLSKGARARIAAQMRAKWRSAKAAGQRHLPAKKQKVPKGTAGSHRAEQNGKVARFREKAGIRIENAREFAGVREGSSFAVGPSASARP